MAISIGPCPPSRAVRSQGCRCVDYVMAIRSLGASDAHILPGMFSEHAAIIIMVATAWTSLISIPP